VSWAVIVNNVAALEILMDCGYSKALALVVVGAITRAVVGWGVLSAVGLEDRVLGDFRGGIPSEGIIDTLRRIGSLG
jgi:lipid intermediate transporter